MKKMLLCATLLALVGCAGSQQKMEREALKDFHKAERVVTSKEVNLTIATGLVANATVELIKAKQEKAEKEAALKEMLGFEVVENE